MAVFVIRREATTSVVGRHSLRCRRSSGAKGCRRSRIFIASLIPGRQFASAFSSGSGARNCLMRAMYFESNRSSPEGELAVGTVVMHRLASGNYARSVCGVVGQRGQFAPGVMSRRMAGDTTNLARLADSILRGKRHPRLAKNVMFFHQAGLRFPYRNMRYVLTAGGNTFYYKASRRRR